ncbi:MAG: bZIP transcription factor, partial [Bacteroidota bacterium]|nr:bZIP transcription factor [Bacteroidota bacterium]
VKKHKHLPGIPTEADVMENGLDLGEMHKKLLEKVEELTLYIMEQEKRIKVLEAEINKDK